MMLETQGSVLEMSLSARLALTLALAAAWPAAARAQSAAASPPVFPVGLDVVNLTVTVLDAEGRLVDDLGPEAFEVYENGRRQELTVFARAGGPGAEAAAPTGDPLALDLGLLMDTSESMLPDLKASQQAAVRFLDAIPRARDLLTIFFDHDIQISRYDSEHQQGLIDRIQSAEGGGGTALYDALAVYLSRIEDDPGRKVAVLFTDGEDSTSTVGLGQLLHMVRSSPVTVYAVAFMDHFPKGSPRATRSRSTLHQLAEITGGEVFNPHSGRDLPGIYQKILDQLSAQYVLGFVSDNPAADGKFRRLKVRVDRKDVRVRHREGYYARKADMAKR
jgi:Ca-activated chloride channel family protein